MTVEALVLATLGVLKPHLLPKSTSSTFTIPFPPSLSLSRLSSPPTPKKVSTASLTTPSQNPPTRPLNPSPLCRKSGNALTSNNHTHPPASTIQSNPKTSNAFPSVWKWTICSRAAASKSVPVALQSWVKAVDFQSLAGCPDVGRDELVEGRSQKRCTLPDMGVPEWRHVFVRWTSGSSPPGPGDL